MDSKVAVVDCRRYNTENVKKAVNKAIDLLGGPEQFVKKEEKIILKPNLLAKAEPEKACTTHPAVFSAAGEILQEAGYRHLYYGDSPGNHLIGVEKTAEGCGILQAAQALGIAPANFSEGVETPFREGRVSKNFILCKGVLQTDAIINLCKMKTHMLERITGAMKNTFGCVYGFNKGASHVKFPSPEIFGKMICDLNVLVKPRLHIMDGIVAMEGNGPHSGNPTSMNVILASADPVALDGLFCRLIHLDPGLVPTNVYGQEYGVGTYENIVVVTENGELSVEDAVQRWGDPDFDVVREPGDRGKLGQVDFLRPVLEKKPYIKKKNCVGCGICVQCCPLEQKALSFKAGKKEPVYDYKRCIRCYCCQEMCPEKAIEVKTSRLARLADRNWRI